VGPPFGHDAIDVIAGEISVRVDLRCAEIDVIQTFEKAVGPIFDSSIFEIAEIVYQGNFHILLAPQSEAAKYEIEHAFKAGVLDWVHSCLPVKDPNRSSAPKTQDSAQKGALHASTSKGSSTASRGLFFPISKQLPHTSQPYRSTGSTRIR
jgi:hypothetical protein